MTDYSPGVICQLIMSRLNTLDALTFSSINPHYSKVCDNFNPEFAFYLRITFRTQSATFSQTQTAFSHIPATVIFLAGDFFGEMGP